MRLRNPCISRIAIALIDGFVPRGQVRGNKTSAQFGADSDVHIYKKLFVHQQVESYIYNADRRSRAASEPINFFVPRNQHLKKLPKIPRRGSLQRETFVN